MNSIKWLYKKHIPHSDNRYGKGNILFVCHSADWYAGCEDMMQSRDRWGAVVNAIM
jgi:hypothetical protein